MRLLEHALSAVRAERSRAGDLGFDLVGVVGSVARGEERPDSDVDIAYDVIEGRSATLFGLGGVAHRLSVALGREVGVIDLSQVRDPYWRDRLEHDLVRA